LSFINKDKPDEQTDDVDKPPEDTAAAAAAADTESDAASVHQSHQQSRSQSAYGAWQTVQQEV